MPAPIEHPAKASGLDADSEEWLRCLTGSGRERDQALARLHELLFKAARFEVGRRRAALAHASADALDDLAIQAADDAMIALLSKVDTYRGASRFTTWAYKFALLEAAVRVRREQWRHREVPLEPEGWARIPDLSCEDGAHSAELLAALRDGIRDRLTPHQRHVLVAITLDGVPIDVLAERLVTTRGALYKTLHDARRKLRRHLEAVGLTGDDAGRSAR
jgi:RNA polymerase sigma-70 factor (ECF subfamily)